LLKWWTESQQISISQQKCRLMKIDRIDAYLVRLPLKKECRLADRPLHHIDSVFVRITGGGLSGWGEVMPGNEPVLTAAWSNGVFICLRDCLIPRLGKRPDIDSGTHLATMLDAIHGNRHAKATLDMAWWDLNAKKRQEPLHESLGGIRRQIALGLTFDRMESQDEFFQELRRAEQDGFCRVSLKIRPGWDINMLSAVRGTFSRLMLQCDLEGALHLNTHSSTLYRFDDFFPTLLEQPLSAKEFVGHAMLQDGLRVPICLDEAVTSLHEAEISFDLRSASVICLKPGRVGGLTEAKTIHDACRSSEVICYSGLDFLSSIGYRHVAAIAALPSCVLPADYLRADEIFEEDPGVPLPTGMAKAGDLDYEIRGFNEVRVAELWSEPGIGFEPNLDVIERHAIDRFTWE